MREGRLVGTWVRAVRVTGRARGSWGRARVLRELRRRVEDAVRRSPLEVSWVEVRVVSWPETERVSLVIFQKRAAPRRETLGSVCRVCLMRVWMSSFWSKDESEQAAPIPSREKKSRARSMDMVRV